MRQSAAIRCYKICPGLDLKRVGNCFKAPVTPGNESLTLSGEMLKPGLGYAPESSAIWLYKYGCICLLGWEDQETFQFINTLETTGIKIDHQLAAKYQDRHQFEWDADSAAEAAEYAAAFAAVLGKSTELWRLEDMVDRLLDESESLVVDLQQGSFGLPARLLQRLNLDLIRLQYDLIQNLKILDRPKECDFRLDLRELYDQTAAGYRIHERFTIVERKISELLAIITPYEDQVYSWKERRVAILETMLVALFPVTYLIQMIIRRF